jgi:transcriptional regulator with XRE-family HTH domain
MTYAQKLRELRDAAGLSEMKLAAKSGVSYFAIHDYGIGRRRPGFAAAAKIARALGTSCDAFVECEDVAGPVKSVPKKPRNGPRKG